ncbi:MAG TPA: hypothetical protein VEY33_14695 [Gemmatimonadota bacterium]|nr:hypothetical protein [Gemmatimonadota bacterium]
MAADHYERQPALDVLRIEQTQPGEPYRLAFDVELRSDGDAERRAVEMEGRRVEIPLELEGPVEIVVDPDGWLLFTTP